MLILIDKRVLINDPLIDQLFPMSEKMRKKNYLFKKLDKE